MKPLFLLAALVFATPCAHIMGEPEGEDSPEGAKPEAKAWVDGLEPLWVLGDSRLRHAGEINRVEPLSDGRRAVICSSDGTARLWDLTTGEEIRRFVDGSNSYVWMAQVLPGDKQVLTTGAVNGIVLWDLETGEQLKKFEHGSSTYRVAISPDGKTIFAVDAADKGVFWNLESGEKIREIKPEKSGFYTGIFLDGGKVVATGGDDETLTYWEVATGKKLGEVKEKETKDIFTLTLSPDGTRFTMCCEGKTLRLREAKQDGKELWQAKFPSAVRVAAWSPDGKLIGATCDDHNLYVVNSEDGVILHKLPVGMDADYAVAFTRDGKEIIGAAKHVLLRFDVKTGKRTFPEAGVDLFASGVKSMVVSKTGEAYVAGGGSDLLVYNLGASGDGEVSRRIATTSTSPSHLAISPDGKYLAALNSSAREILVFDAKSGKQTKSFKPASTVKGLLFADDERLVVGTSGKEVEVWSVVTGAKIRALTGHTESVEGLSVSGDGKRLASFSDDGTIRLWDLATGVQIDGVGIGDAEAATRDFEGGTFFGEDGRAILADRGTMLDYWEAPEIVEERPSPEAVEKLYADLNSDAFLVRQEATKRLIEMGNGSLQAIEDKFGGDENRDAELALRLEKVRSKIASSSKMGKAKGTLGLGSGFHGVSSYDSQNLWVGVEGSSAAATLVVGDVHEGKPRVLRRLADGHGPAVFQIDEANQRIVTGNRDGTVTVWGLGGAGEKEGDE